MQQKHTCNNPHHRKEVMLTKIILALLIIVVFNTFTSVFIIFTLYTSRVSSPTDILNPSLYLPNQTKKKTPAKKELLELNDLSLGDMQALEYMDDEDDEFDTVDIAALENALNMEYLDDLDTFLEVVDRKLDNL